VSLLFTLFLIGATLLIAIGVYGIVVTRNLMRILLSVEVLTKAVTLVMIGAGYETGQMGVAQSFVITIIVIEVMLLVIATGILFGVYRNNGSLMTDQLNNLKG
jgi:NADH:ubiquinone oxidoreductase subunit K